MRLPTSASSDSEETGPSGGKIRVQGCVACLARIISSYEGLPKKFIMRITKSQRNRRSRTRSVNPERRELD